MLTQSIALPQIAEDTLPWSVPEWLQQQMQNAWDAWQLQHGDPDQVLSERGREKLEQELERFFSKWVWQWDVERQIASPLHASAPPPPRVGIVAETGASLGSCMDTPASSLTKPMAWLEKASKDLSDAPAETLLLRDDQMLWPQAHTHEAEQSALDAHDRRKIAMYVLAHLVRLDQARADEAKAWANVRQSKHTEPATYLPNALPSTDSVAGFFSDSSSWLGLDRVWSAAKKTAEYTKASTVGNGKAPDASRRTTPPTTSATHDRFRPTAPDAAGASSPELSETLDVPEPDNATESDDASEPDAPDADLSGVPADDLAESVDPLATMGLNSGHTTSEAQEHHIPFPVREQSALFSTNAPFQTLHEQLNQALGSDDNDTAPASSSATAPRHSHAHAAYAAANPLTSASPSVPQGPVEKPAGAQQPRTKPVPADHTEEPAANHTSKQFPPLPASRTSWYHAPRRAKTADAPFPHDPALDGWGQEMPQAWRHAQLHLGHAGQSPVYITYTTVRAVY